MRRLVFGWTAMALSALLARADSPGMIHYQGRLALGTNLYSGPVNIEFRIYDAPTGGTLLHTSTNAATAVDGLYATAIGEHVLMGTLSRALTNAQVWLEVQVNGSTLTPRERLLAVPFAQAVEGMRLYPNGSLALNAERGTNQIYSSFFSTISGGRENIVESNTSFATISGGDRNQVHARANYAVIGGGINNQVAANADFAIIGGGSSNLVETNAWGAAILGGGVLSEDGITGMPGGNRIYSSASMIGGGFRNEISTNAILSVIAGGQYNKIDARSRLSAIGGGYINRIGVSALYATIPGGRENEIGAQATNSLAAGRRAKALHRGSFVWGDDTDADFATTANNQFLIRSAGGVGINTEAPEAELHIFRGSAGSVTALGTTALAVEGSTNTFIQFLTATNAISGIIMGSPVDSLDSSIRYNHFGNREMIFRVGGNNTRMLIDTNGFVGIGTLSPTNRLHVVGTVQATAYITSSDRSLKDNIQPVNPADILEKVAALPISTWTFRDEPNGTHIGPMAQDFHAAFGFGNTDSGIMTVDADGVLFAAVQALAKEKENIRRENEELRRRLEALEAKLSNF